MYSRSDHHSTAWPPGHIPVPIALPSNECQRIQQPAPTSTRYKNPYNRPINTKPSVGNTTSRSTLLQTGSSMSSGPPLKRPRLDAHSRGRNKEYPLVIPDDDVGGPDELNLRSDSPNTRPSKYYASDTRVSKRYTILGDGETTKEIAPRYSPDSIEEFSPTNDNGFVSKRIDQFENNKTRHETRIPKVDFLKVGMKPKSKGRLLSSKSLLTRTQYAKPQLGDQSDKIPVHSFFSNAQLWKSMPHQQLWMYTRNRSLFIDENSRTIVNEPVVGAYTITLAKPSEVEMSSLPTIQLKPQNHEKETMTIQLDTQNSHWNKAGYIRFVGTLEFPNQFMRSEHTFRLWQTAEQNAAETLKHKISASDPEEIQSKPIQTNIDQPRSRQARITTTSLKRKADLDYLDAQATSPNHQPGFETGRSRHRPNASPTERNLRSRKKLALDTEPVPSPPPANPDEVVLSYPAGLPGAVNITNVDLERLNPGAFLNDTLIEFGLKVWLKDLENSNPELANQIHVFSSFFYKKFNTKKDSQLAYESVRKWTNKFDIFQKRYIIVPINEHLHWYLAVIYEPEHVLKDPPVNYKSPPRPQTRLSTAQAMSESDYDSSRIGQDLDSLETQMEDLDQHSEVEVECDLGDFQSSCTIEDRVPRQPDHSDPSVVASPSSHVAGERFYQSSSIHGKKKKAQSDIQSPATNDPHEQDEVEFIDNVPKTYIFTFDSLGNRHLQAVRKLSAYLKMEAKDKKGVDARGITEGKGAPVPFQTNFCDCGIYLLHFARTFMIDPRKYATIIMSPRPKSIGDAERKTLWLVDKDFEPEGRQRLRLRIEALSKDWKKLRDDAQKQPEATIRDEESEGEVELVESDTSKHSKSRRKSQPQGQKTGPASRVRG